MTPIKEVKFERIYDVPLDLVWKAWTDPDLLKKWWGPDNVIIPECEVDLRVGGLFYIVMEAGEGMGSYKGVRWPMRAEFTIVEPKTKISYKAKAWTQGIEEETLIDQATEIVLSQKDSKTKINLKAAIYKIGPQASMAVEGMQLGFTQQLEKLNLFLANH